MAVIDILGCTCGITKLKGGVRGHVMADTDCSPVPVVKFSSVGDFFDTSLANPIKGALSKSERSDFYEATQEQIKDWAKRGWAEGVERITKFRADIKSKLADEPMIMWSHEGYDFDVAGVVSEEPEHWLVRDAVKVRACRILLNCSASCGVEASKLNLRAAALVSFVDVLQTENIAVDLTVFHGGSGGYSWGALTHVGASPIPLGMLAACTHASALRRHGFAICEQQHDEKHCSGYGTPCNIKTKWAKENIGIDFNLSCAMRTGEDNELCRVETVKDAVKWVQKQVEIFNSTDDNEEEVE